MRSIAVGDSVVAMADSNGDGGWVAGRGGDGGYALAREFNYLASWILSYVTGIGVRSFLLD